jgi:NAD(P)-dependent dehydrogenase (short-subunit alcohol dehydrogenase family)
MLRLEGRKALVTGASKGVGKGIALELARDGCDLAVNYHTDRAGADQTAAKICRMGRKAFVVQGDAGRAADVDAVMAAVLEQFGRLDILVNNAGCQTWSPLLELKEPDWDRVIDTNLKGCYLCMQRAGRQMRAQGGGSIVNIGSGCSKWPFPSLVDYTASKQGIEGLTKVAAVELGPYGIRVNCVAPGAIEIERTKQELGDYSRTWAGLTPLGRIGLPADVGRAVAFLASDDSSFVTGQTLWVDGGLYTRPVWPHEERKS